MERKERRCEHAEATRARIETQLHEWGAELEKLKAKVDKEIAEAKKDYYEHLEDLRDDIESHVRKWGPEGEGLKELRAKIEAELKAWGPQIHSLHVAAETEAKRLIEDLKAKKKAVKARLTEVKQAGDSAWADVKTGTGKAWEELRDRPSRARSRGSSRLERGAGGSATISRRAAVTAERHEASRRQTPIHVSGGTRLRDDELEKVTNDAAAAPHGSRQGAPGNPGGHNAASS